MSITVRVSDVEFEVEDIPDRSATVPDPEYTFTLRLHLPVASESRTGQDPHYATVVSSSERNLAAVQ